METNKIILVGGGGHAKACIDVIRATGKYTIIGYTDLREGLQDFPEIPYLGNDDCLFKYIDQVLFLISIGQIKSPKLRVKIFERLQSASASFATIVSPYAYVSSTARIGPGSIVMHGAIIQSCATIGVNCIINDRALLEHDCYIGNHCHISTGAILNGNVSTGNEIFVGSGALVKNNVSIADKAVVGMGAIVLNNVLENKTVIGNPAK